MESEEVQVIENQPIDIADQEIELKTEEQKVARKESHEAKPTTDEATEEYIEILQKKAKRIQELVDDPNWKKAGTKVNHYLAYSYCFV